MLAGGALVQTKSLTIKSTWLTLLLGSLAHTGIQNKINIDRAYLPNSDNKLLVKDEPKSQTLSNLNHPK